MISTNNVPSAPSAPESRAHAAAAQAYSRIYRWKAFHLTIEADTGTVTTHYADERWSGCAPHEDDAHHAKRLGITPAEHRLAHELAHHLVGLTYYGNGLGSPIIWRDAHGFPQPARESELEEWMATALSYVAFGRSCDDYGALLDLSRTCDPMKLARALRWMMEAPEGVEIEMDGATRLRNLT